MGVSRDRIEPGVLLELQSALAAGAAPGPALAAVARDGVLEPVARDVRLGRPLADIAAEVATGDPSADLLVRALAVAERTGAGACEAVEQAGTALREEAALRRLVAVRTAQARGTAIVLTALPPVVWLLLVAVDGAALRFYRMPLGLLTGVAAGVLASLSWLLMNRLVRAAAAAAVTADPLTGPPPAPDWSRAVAAGGGVLLVAGVIAGPAVALLTATAVGAGALRGRRRLPSTRSSAGGAAEAVELVGVALAAGLPIGGALAAVAPLAPPAAAPLLETAARRVRGGWGVATALEGQGLASLGTTLAAAERWGVPAQDALRRLAADLRADRRAAAEEAAERLQLLLVFPTTLLTLPAFVLGVVPPLLWTTLGA